MTVTAPPTEWLHLYRCVGKRNGKVIVRCTVAARRESEAVGIASAHFPEAIFSRIGGVFSTDRAPREGVIHWRSDAQ